MSISFQILVFLVLVALAFDFMNGFHDAANSIATIVSTRVLKPHWAVIWAAFFNFAALFIFELKVASTVGRGIVDTAIVDHHVVFGALTGALSWNVITWYYGIPSSFVARSDRGHRWGGGRQGGLERAHRERTGETRDFHRALAASRLRARLDPPAARILDLRARHPGARGQMVPATSVPVRVLLQPRSRGKRRTENRGYHLDAADRGWSLHPKGAHPLLGGHRLLRDHRVGHAFRGLAHR